MELFKHRENAPGRTQRTELRWCVSGCITSCCCPCFSVRWRTVTRLMHFHAGKGQLTERCQAAALSPPPVGVGRRRESLPLKLRLASKYRRPGRKRVRWNHHSETITQSIKTGSFWIPRPSCRRARGGGGTLGSADQKIAMALVPTRINREDLEVENAATTAARDLNHRDPN